MVQHFSPIFDRTNKIVQKQAFVKVLVDMFTHNHKYNEYQYATSEAEPRGILLIKNSAEVFPPVFHTF